MRRILFAALLFFVVASCAYRPVFVDRPVLQPGIGSVSPKIAQLRPQGKGFVVCHEISRARCDVATCKGSSMDLVTLSCGSEKVSRCEIGKGGC